MNIPRVHITTAWQEDKTWVNSEQDKAKLYAGLHEHVFQQKYIVSRLIWYNINHLMEHEKNPITRGKALH